MSDSDKQRERAPEQSPAAPVPERRGLEFIPASVPPATHPSQQPAISPSPDTEKPQQGTEK